MIALDAVHPEDRDVAVKGPLWDSHIISTIDETAGEIADRRRVMQQASRRVKRSVEDQALILECKSNELANFH